MKVIQANTHCEASLLLHTVFQPTLVSPQNQDPKIDRDNLLTPFSPPTQSLNSRALSMPTCISTRKPRIQQATAKTMIDALLHEKRKQRKDQGEVEVLALINNLLTLTRCPRTTSTIHLAFSKNHRILSFPWFSDLKSYFPPCYESLTST